LVSVAVFVHKAMFRGTMAKILLVSYVRELDEDRDKVLRAAGYDVTLVVTYAEAIQAVEQQIFDVAILGYTVPEGERNQLAGAIKETNPGTQIIVFYFTSIGKTEHADVLMQTTASAEDLLRAVEHTVSKRDRSRTG
jgi:CheY-like chemotaxis protein